jgi:hypothetical protein
MAKMTIEQILEAGGKVTTKTPDGKPDPVLTIAASAALKLGRHDFELVVTDDAGNDSSPLRVTILVVDTQRPNAVVNVLDERGQPLEDNRVPRKTNFILDASKSFDPNDGTITGYLWRYIREF